MAGVAVGCIGRSIGRWSFAEHGIAGGRCLRVAGGASHGGSMLAWQPVLQSVLDFGLLAKTLPIAFIPPIPPPRVARIPLGPLACYPNPRV